MTELNDVVPPVDMIAAFVTSCGGINNAVYILRRNVTSHRITTRWFCDRKEFPVEVINVMYGYLVNNNS